MWLWKSSQSGGHTSLPSQDGTQPGVSLGRSLYPRSSSHAWWSLHQISLLKRSSRFGSGLLIGMGWERVGRQLNAYLNDATTTTHMTKYTHIWTHKETLITASIYNIRVVQADHIDSCQRNSRTIPVANLLHSNCTPLLFWVRNTGGLGNLHN